MTENEKLDLILSEIQGMKDEMQGMKDEMQGMKDEMQGMKDDIQGMKDEIPGMKGEMQGMKGEIQGMKGEIQKLEQRTAAIELTLENDTNHSIRLLAENHLMLVDKLNEAIKAADKNDLLEVQMISLRKEVKNLRKDVSAIQKSMAL